MKNYNQGIIEVKKILQCKLKNYRKNYETNIVGRATLNDLSSL
jgi:hypothetical protein